MVLPSHLPILSTASHGRFMHVLRIPNCFDTFIFPLKEQDLIHYHINGIDYAGHCSIVLDSNF